MLPSVVVVADDTSAMAVFNKHTLVYNAERGAGVIVVNAALSVAGACALGNAEVCWSGCDCVVSVRKAWQRLVWCRFLHSLHVNLEVHCVTFMPGKTVEAQIVSLHN